MINKKLTTFVGGMIVGAIVTSPTAKKIRYRLTNAVANSFKNAVTRNVKTFVEKNVFSDMQAPIPRENPIDISIEPDGRVFVSSKDGKLILDFVNLIKARFDQTNGRISVADLKGALNRETNFQETNIGWTTWDSYMSPFLIRGRYHYVFPTPESLPPVIP